MGRGQTVSRNAAIGTAAAGGVCPRPRAGRMGAAGAAAARSAGEPAPLRRTAGSGGPCAGFGCARDASRRRQRGARADTPGARYGDPRAFRPVSRRAAVHRDRRRGRRDRRGRRRGGAAGRARPGHGGRRPAFGRRSRLRARLPLHRARRAPTLRAVQLDGGARHAGRGPQRARRHGHRAPRIGGHGLCGRRCRGIFLFGPVSWPPVACRALYRPPVYARCLGGLPGRRGAAVGGRRRRAVRCGRRFHRPLRLSFAPPVPDTGGRKPARRRASRPG